MANASTMERQVILATTSGATAIGGRLFKKEVLHVGSWVHPDTGDQVAFSREDLVAIADATNAFIAIQGPIPFPDNHSFSALKNLGFWSHFFVEGDRLFGIVEAGTDEIAAKLGTTIRDVSVFLESKVRDSKGGEHHNVLSHVAATNYGVVTDQSNFVALAREGKEERVPVYRPEKEGGMHEGLTKVAATLGIAVEGLEEPALVAALEAKAKALADGASSAKDALALAVNHEAAALAAKTEASALAARVLALEKDIAEREGIECDREVSEVKALAAKHGKPEALEATREKFIRDRWVRDHEAAKQMLALAREIATSGPGTQIEGAVAVKTPEKESLALAKADAIETAKREARAMGFQTRVEAGKLVAFRPGEKREIVLVG